MKIITTTTTLRSGKSLASNLLRVFSSVTVIAGLLMPAAYASPQAIPASQAATGVLAPLWRLADEGLTPEAQAKRQAKRVKPVSVGSEPIAIQLNRERLLGKGQRMELVLPNGKRQVILHTESLVSEGPNGEVMTTWVGELEGWGNDFRTLLTLGPAGVYGWIKTPEGDFSIAPGADGTDWLIDLTEEQLHRPLPVAKNDARYPTEDLLLPATPHSKADPVCPATPTKPSPQTTVDLMIVYTDSFVTVHGAANVATRLKALVDGANVIFADSNVAITLRLVHSTRLSGFTFTNAQVDGTVLDNITNGVAPFGGIAALRNTHGADLVSLVGGSSTNGISGIAWVGGSNAQDIARSANVMYSILTDAPAFNASVFTHELGHNMGNQHDRATETQLNLLQPTNFGATSYSFGHFACGAVKCLSTDSQTGACAQQGCDPASASTGNDFGTIMSYISPQVSKFSSPDLLCKNRAGVSKACGVAAGQPNGADNVRSMNCMRTKLAAMRTVAPPPCSATADTDGDGLNDCLEATLGLNVAVKDNDIFTATAAGNRLFASQQYRDFLGREGDAGGITFWTTQLGSGAASRAQTVENFFNSPEFQANVAPIARLYFATYNRVPDTSGLLFWIGQFRGGRSINSIAETFATAPEFVAKFGNLGVSDYVRQIYLSVLKREPDSAGQAFWVSQINSGAKTRGALLASFSESDEFKAAAKSNVYVTMIYTGMLGRAPDASGFTFWTGELQAGRSGLGLIGQFLAAPEYRKRFLP